MYKDDKNNDSEKKIVYIIETFIKVNMYWVLTKSQTSLSLVLWESYAAIPILQMRKLTVKEVN